MRTNKGHACTCNDMQSKHNDNKAFFHFKKPSLHNPKFKQYYRKTTLVY